MLLAMASQRIEYLIGVSIRTGEQNILKLFPVEILADLLEDDDLYNLVREWERTERGSLPSYTEALIILWQVRNTK